MTRIPGILVYLQWTNVVHHRGTVRRHERVRKVGSMSNGNAPAPPHHGTPETSHRRRAEPQNYHPWMSFKLFFSTFDLPLAANTRRLMGLTMWSLSSLTNQTIFLRNPPLHLRRGCLHFWTGCRYASRPRRSAAEFNELIGLWASPSASCRVGAGPPSKKLRKLVHITRCRAG